MKLTKAFLMLLRLLLIALATGMHQPAIIKAWRKGDQEKGLVAVLEMTSRIDRFNFSEAF